MSLDGPLPAAQGQPNTLVVEVGSEHSKLVGQPATLGDYGDRVIRLFPCPHCSVGALTHTFLHELAHAWIDVYQPDFLIGGPEEEFAGAFSDLAFAALPGTAGSSCSGYVLELPVTARRSRGFQRFFEHFVEACPPKINPAAAVAACRTAAEAMSLAVVEQGVGGEPDVYG